MSAIDNIGESLLCNQYKPEQLLGLDYITSAAKAEYDRAVGSAVLPLAKIGGAITEFAIYGSIDAGHRFEQDRDVVGKLLSIPKIRTMHEAPVGRRDIDRYSPRIVNKRARVARIIGADELPQWERVATGDMSLVGPRPILRESLDKFSMLAEEGGTSEDKVEEWRDLLRMARPGLFGKSQAMRHKLSVNEYTPSASVAIVASDLEYKALASPSYDKKVMAYSMATMLVEGMKAIIKAR